MQRDTALVLMSCVLCQQLHEPRAVDDLHPVCARCAAPAPPAPAPLQLY